LPKLRPAEKDKKKAERRSLAEGACSEWSLAAPQAAIPESAQPNHFQSGLAPHNRLGLPRWACCQPVLEIAATDQWFVTEFLKYVNALDKLPFDHHMLAALVPPRPLLVVENSGIDYLGPIS